MLDAKIIFAHDAGMDNLSYVKGQLAQASDRQLREIADAAGLSFWTLKKVKSGATANPGYRTVMRLDTYLRRYPVDAAPVISSVQSPPCTVSPD